MSTQIMSEREFEDRLIEKLTTGEVDPFTSQEDINFTKVFRSRLWEYRSDIKTVGQMEQNFKEILEHNNQQTLDGPLSPIEFQQVMEQINALSTPYKAGKFLYGYHGVSQVEVNLDNGRHVFLTVFDQAQIGAGNTVYQVVNQIERPAVYDKNRDRRFDVTLLINGLPIYQIELKGPEHDVNEALNQMEQYVNEDLFTGIFSTVQILMAMTPYNTKYMARPEKGAFNKDFAFKWKNEKNKNVGRWEEIADHMLTIPAAHQLATNYMILDGSKNAEAIKVMRPYQVAATGKALERIRSTDFSRKLNKDGYIWHTTGSGKTITSYKTASLASKLPNIDKVVFLVDRKSLTRQTLECYRGYDPESSSDEINQYSSIEDTKNTNQLSRKLKSKDNSILITSTQKLHKLINREKFIAPDKNFLFIVDEAHRSTGTKKFGEIQEKFPHSAWIGYSGTPVFERAHDKQPTKEVFGPLLHAYTIRDAIADQSVLGFKVEFNTTIPDEQKVEALTNYYAELRPDWTDKQIAEKINNMTPDDMDDEVSGGFYDNNPKHIEAVVRDIMTYWENRSSGYRYNALLTTHVHKRGASIPMALSYYKEFKKQNALREQAGLQPLKVAVSISLDETNGSQMNETNSGLKEAIEDYNKMFGTSFGTDTVEEYNMDLEDRLRKSSGDGKYLDLVIVVDRLLTGFDAPELNTLYVDRLLHGATLIQAYSRTNRIHNMNTKPFGNIVNYRWADYAEELMNDALAVYSNVDNANLTPKEKKERNTIDGITALPFTEQVAKTIEIIGRIMEMTDRLEHIPTEPERQDNLLKLLRDYNAQIAKLKQYPPQIEEDGEIIEGFDYNNPESLLKTLQITDDQAHQISVTLGNELKEAIAKRKGISPQLIDLRVEHLKEVLVDYDFLTELMETLMNQVYENKMSEAAETKEQILKFSKSMENRTYARQVEDAVEGILLKAFPDADSGLQYPYKLRSTTELMKNIQKAQTSYIDCQMDDFRKKWGIQDVVSSPDLRNLVTSPESEASAAGKTRIEDIVSEGSNEYRKASEDETVRQIKKIPYRNKLRTALSELIKKFTGE